MLISGVYLLWKPLLWALVLHWLFHLPKQSIACCPTSPPIGKLLETSQRSAKVGRLGKVCGQVFSGEPRGGDEFREICAIFLRVAFVLLKEREGEEVPRGPVGTV